MTERPELKGILQWPLIVAAVVTVLRVVVERMGMAEGLSNLFSVVALHLVLGPLYFAIRIGLSGIRHPYTALFKFVSLYVVLTRAMILPTYWLGRIYAWPQSRFAGLSGPDVSAFRGFIGVPFGTAAIWIVASVILGGALGVIVVAVVSRFGPNKTAGARL